MAFKEFHPFQFKKQQIKKQQDIFFKHYHTPTIPQADNVTNSIIYHATNLGGIIAGGTALKFFNPQWRTSDVDIIVRGNKFIFAQQLVHRLNIQYANRFKTVTKNAAVSIYDKKNNKFVADVVNNPYQEEHTVQVSGMEIVKPEAVFFGKYEGVVKKSNFVINNINKFI